MVKANGFIEALGLEKRFYKDWDIVYVRLPNNNVEKHYYPVDPKGKIKVYPNENDLLLNPTIKDTGKVTVDQKTKRNVYQWVIGRQYATPLFSTEQMSKPLITDEDIDQYVNIGIKWDKLTNPKKADGKDPISTILLAVAIIGIMNLVILFFVYQIADKMGIVKELLHGVGA